MKIDNEKFGGIKKHPYICIINFGIKMTDEKEILVRDFKQRLSQLITICDRLREEKDALEDKYARLQESFATLEDDNKQLRLQNDNLKTINSLLTGSDSHDTKIKLNRIVREIDKCLSLLNN